MKDRTLTLMAVALLVVACDKDRSTYTVGGTASGLEGSGLVLDLNTEQILGVEADGPFTFEVPLDDATAWVVTVIGQPTEPEQVCTVTGASGTIDGADVTDVSVVCVTVDDTIEVTPLFEGYQGWTDCILDDADDPHDASGVACTDGAGCIMAGMFRTVSLPVLADCTGVTATDSRGVFEWVCMDDGGDVSVVSSGFAEGTLSDLIDPVALEWRGLQVIVQVDGTEVARTVESVWWDSPIEALPDSDGTGPVTLDAPGTIYVLGADAGSDGILIDADGVALVTMDATLTYNDVGTHNCAGGTGEATPADSECLVAAGGQKCLWIEGSYEAGAAAHGILLSDTDSSVVFDFYVGGAIDGLCLENGSSYNVAEDAWVTGASQNCIVLAGGATGNHVAHMLVDDAGEDAVSLQDADGNTFYSVSCEGTGDDGWDLTDSDDNVFTEVWAYDNDQGFRLANSKRNTFEDLETGWCSDDSYYLELGSDDNVFIDARARENFYTALHIYEASGNRFYGTRFSGNGFTDGGGIWLEYADGSVFVDTVLASNNLGGFYSVNSEDVTVVGMITVNNEDDGFHCSDGSQGITVAHVTSANSSGTGFVMHNTDAVLGGVLVNSVAANSGLVGLDVVMSTSLRVTDFAAYSSGEYGLAVMEMNDTVFGGMLMVGASGTEDCTVFGGTTPGLEDLTCANTGDSDATLSTGIDLSASFLGAVTIDDTTNDDDADGAATGGEFSDWLSFDTPYRGWGLDAGAWPDTTNHVGACWDTMSCRIQDWRLDAADSALLEAHGAATDGETCPASVHGDVAITDFQTTPNTFLIHAMELLFDAVGDEDGLCETDETCLYAPNIGGYQGDGDHTAESCAFVDGTVTGVTMQLLSENGL